jgi:hypothetical protein
LAVQSFNSQSARLTGSRFRIFADSMSIRVKKLPESVAKSNKLAGS